MVFYRVKEFNKAYDHIFGKGKGWIYVSNEYDFEAIAMIHAACHQFKTGHKTIVKKGHKNSIHLLTCGN